MQSSRTIETIKISEKFAICEFHIESIEIEVLGSRIRSNKWLRWDEWQQLYDILNTSLSNNLEDPVQAIKKSFEVGQCILVDVELAPLDEVYLRMFGLDLNDCLSELLKIRVRQRKPSTETLEGQSSRDRYNDQTDRKSKRHKKRKNSAYSKYDPTNVRHKSSSEYTPRPASRSYVPYTPSKVSPKNEEAEDRYSPKPIKCEDDDDTTLNENFVAYTVPSSTENPEAIPKYKASTIVKSNTDEGAYTERSVRGGGKCTEALVDSGTPVPTNEDVVKKPENRKRRAITPAKLHRRRLQSSEDLFASEEEDLALKDYNHEPTYGTRSTSRKQSEPKMNDQAKVEVIKSKNSTERHASKSSKRKEMAAKVPKESLSSSLSTPRKHEDRDNRHNSHSRKDKILKPSRSKSKPQTPSTQSPSKTPSSPDDSIFLTPITPPKPTIEELRKRQVANERDIALLETFNKQIKQLNRSPPEVDIISLNNISNNDLLATFEEFRPVLTEYFEKYKGQARFRFNGYNDQLNLLIMNVINRARSLSMLDHLQAFYEPQCDGVPTYTDLFMNIILPEWVLLIFMKKFKFTRSDAINHMKMQQEREALNSSQMM